MSQLVWLSLQYKSSKSTSKKKQTFEPCDQFDFNTKCWNEISWLVVKVSENFVSKIAQCSMNYGSLALIILSGTIRFACKTFVSKEAGLLFETFEA